MISVCCCAINAKWDVKTFVESICRHNQDTEFEIVLTHDNRVDDGGTEFFKELSEKHPQFRTVEHTNQDTINYLKWCLDVYNFRQRWTSDFREHLRRNLELYERDLFLDKTKSFLWISSGILYNKAIMAAKGDIFVVTPADFLLPFSLGKLEKHVNKTKHRDGRFYSKPGAVWARVSNAPVDFLKEKVSEIHGIVSSGSELRPGILSEVGRDYLQYPSELSETYVADFNKGELISLDYEGFLGKMKDFILNRRNNPRSLEHSTCTFHGVHVMTRESWNYLGGFTEEWYGRAFADDKTTRRGHILHTDTPVPLGLPDEYTILWPGQGEYIQSLFPYYPKNHLEVLKSKDPWFDKHPIPGISGTRYLHDEFKDRDYMNSLNRILEYYIGEPTIRFTNGDR